MKSTGREKSARYPEKMREKAMSIAMKRKEEYLGARVPKSLKERVIKRADEMEIPVSLLIRKVLEEAFSEDSSSLTDLLASKNVLPAQNNAKKSEKYADIVGWKSIEVNHDRSCERCREPLPRGAEAFLGFTASDSSYVIVCHQCKSQIISEQ